jgi:hypothetical protein
LPCFTSCITRFRIVSWNENDELLQVRHQRPVRIVHPDRLVRGVGAQHGAVHPLVDRRAHLARLFGGQAIGLRELRAPLRVHLHLAGLEAQLGQPALAVRVGLAVACLARNLSAASVAPTRMDVLNCSIRLKRKNVSFHLARPVAHHALRVARAQRVPSIASSMAPIVSASWWPRPCRVLLEAFADLAHAALERVQASRTVPPRTTMPPGSTTELKIASGSSRMFWYTIMLPIRRRAVGLMSSPSVPSMPRTKSCAMSICFLPWRRAQLGLREHVLHARAVVAEAPRPLGAARCLRDVAVHRVEQVLLHERRRVCRIDERSARAP